MRAKCPKCKKDFSTEPKLIDGKTAFVCPHCGFWDSSREEGRILDRWVISPCKTCANNEWVEDLWREPTERKCIHNDELNNSVDEYALMRGKCRLYKEA